MADPAILMTDRLVLRAPQPRDAAQITERVGLKDVAWNLGRVPYPYALSDAEAFIKHATEAWADNRGCIFMLEHPTDGVIGCTGLDLHGERYWEIGYWVGKPWWGQGFVTEAATAVMNWAENEMGFSEFVSGHFIDNPKSGRVLSKLGFKSVGLVEHMGAARGVLTPAMRYTKGAPDEIALKTATH